MTARRTQSILTVLTFLVCMSGTTLISPTVSPEICAAHANEPAPGRARRNMGQSETYLPGLQRLWDDAYDTLLAQAGIDCLSDLPHETYIAACTHNAIVYQA